MTEATDIPLSLYIHVPWCVRKCPYCDFNSHEHSQPPEEAYLAALLRDLDGEAARASGRRLQTVFIGGGTPSLMSAAFYQQLMAAVDERVGLAADAEITLEANPGTAEQARFDGYRQAGINRLSIGIQSLDAAQLTRLGRIHDPDQARQAITMARRAGFTRVNLDLMHGLPEQTEKQALTDLDGCIALEPDHISWYELTIEPNTAFWSRPPALPDPDQVADVEAAGFERLAAAGFTRYEVSAFARPDQACRHNLNYWRFGDYLALGAGAHGKISDAGAVHRYHKTRLPDHYLKAVDPCRGLQPLAARERALEFFLNGLRLLDGVDLARFPERTGMAVEPLDDLLDSLVRDGLLDRQQSQLRCTDTGLRHLNSVLATLDEGIGDIL